MVASLLPLRIKLSNYEINIGFHAFVSVIDVTGAAGI
jgi:hypothetical protein